MQHFTVPMIVAFVQSVAIKKKKKKAVASQYPDIDSNISFDELELALANKKILKYKEENDKIYNFYDITGYKNYIRSIELKDEMKKEDSYKCLKNDFSISDEELEKVKVKVKTMVRK